MKNLRLNSDLKSLILALGIVLIATLVLNSEPIVKSVSAEEVYPIFSCPCCSQPLDKNNICCEAAQERISYIDSLTAQKLSEKEIILTYIKRYGMNSFIDNKKQEEVKAWLVEIAPKARPQITLNAESYDWGDISEAKGVAVTFFELKNEGKKDLAINKLDTSCGCTSAAIIYQGNEGPRFAMAGHGIESPTNWKVMIPPGESAQLKVYYDPGIHKGFRGPATREISVFSNDPINFEKKVTIELNQVP